VFLPSRKMCLFGLTVVKKFSNLCRKEFL